MFEGKYCKGFVTECNTVVFGEADITFNFVHCKRTKIDSSLQKSWITLGRTFEARGRGADGQEIPVLKNQWKKKGGR